jgi:hypothetical protein
MVIKKAADCGSATETFLDPLLLVEDTYIITYNIGLVKSFLT